MNLSKEECEFYHRQIKLKGFGLAAQMRLKQSRIVVFGAGGLAAGLLPILAGSGVNFIRIIDGDTISLSNLHRQSLFTFDAIGKAKAEVAALFCRRLNPFITVEFHNQFLQEANAEEFIQDVDIIVDATDNFPIRFFINDLAVYFQKINVYASIFETMGQLSSYIPELSPCLRCSYPVLPAEDEVPNCAENGILPSMSQLSGALQAEEVLRIASGQTAHFSESLLNIDCRSMQFRHFSKKKNPDCPICSSKRKRIYPKLTNYQCPADIAEYELSFASMNEMIKHGARLIDIREKFERNIHFIPDSEHLTIDEILNGIHTLKTELPMIFYCQSGKRSRDLIRTLHQKNIKNVFHLKGGILEYIHEKLDR